MISIPIIMVLLKRLIMPPFTQTSLPADNDELLCFAHAQPLHLTKSRPSSSSPSQLFLFRLPRVSFPWLKRCHVGQQKARESVIQVYDMVAAAMTGTFAGKRRRWPATTCRSLAMCMRQRSCSVSWPGDPLHSLRIQLLSLPPACPLAPPVYF